MRRTAILLVTAAVALGTPALAQQPANQGTSTQNSGPPAGAAATAPSAQNSGAGISGAPGNKNGPAAGTVGSSSQNTSVQQQDPANIKGLPGNKSGPPAKR
jgi:hypothetical protein